MVVAAGDAVDNAVIAAVVVVVAACDAVDNAVVVVVAAFAAADVVGAAGYAAVVGVAVDAVDDTVIATVDIAVAAVDTGYCCCWLQFLFKNAFHLSIERAVAKIYFIK